MKEQIFELLYEHIETVHIIDSPHDCDLAADKLELLIATEVERRIAERLPSEEEIKDELCRHLYDWYENNSFKDACQWYRSRLTENKQEKDFKCDKCGYEFDTLDALAWHKTYKGVCKKNKQEGGAK